MTRLTTTERQGAMLLCGMIAFAGLILAVIGRGDPMGIHGWITLIIAGTLFFVVGNAIYEPEPTEDRSKSYYDDPTKVGILLALF